MKSKNTNDKLNRLNKNS